MTQTATTRRPIPQTAARSFKPPFWKFEPDIKLNENPECPRALVCLPFVCCQLYLTGYEPPDDQGRDVFQFICITRYDHSKIVGFYRCNPVMLKIGFCFGADRLFTFPQKQARDREAQIWLQTGP